MRLSVIIPFHLELNYIDRSIASVHANVSNIDSCEILVCNDGVYSPERILAHISPRNRLWVRILTNTYEKGPGGARNTGLDSATGDLVAFLDADDYWLSGKIDAQLEILKAGATFVTTGYRLDTGHAVISPPDRINNPLDIFLCRGIGTSTVLATRELCGDMRFRNIRFSQDIDYWYLLAGSHLFSYGCTDEQFVVYSTGGTTKNKLVQLKYLNKVLNINEISFISRLRILISYSSLGIYNHYIRRFLRWFGPNNF